MIIRVTLLLFLSCGVLISDALAQAKLPKVAPAAGLTVSLIPSGYSFPTEPLPVSGGRGVKRTVAPAESFLCTATLRNHTKADVVLTYPTEEAAAERLHFRILNQEGDVVWSSTKISSLAPLEAQKEPVFTAVFKRKTTVRRTVRLPLKVNGEWLPAGRYTLEAAVGTSDPSASTVFIVGGATPLAPEQGAISGQVYKTTGESQRTAVVAEVTIRRADLPANDPNVVVWSGQTDGSGLYRVLLPTGSYLISINDLDATVETRQPTRSCKLQPGDEFRADFPLYDPVYLNTLIQLAGISNVAFGAGTEQGASAMVTASGTWFDGSATNPRLVLRSATSSAAGEVDLDFVIDRTSGGIHVPTTHTAEAMIRIPYGTRKINVHGQRSSGSYKVPTWVWGFEQGRQ